MNLKLIEPTRGTNIPDVLMIKPNELYRETEVIGGINDHEAVFVLVKNKCDKIRQYYEVDKSGMGIKKTIMINGKW